MGIFTGNRTILGSETQVDVNEAYATEYGALMLVAESYQNDATIFNNIITCDFLEAAILKEADEEGKETVDAAKENLLKRLWNTILSAIKKVKEKIQGIVEGAQKKFREWKKSNVEKLVDKRGKDFDANIGRMADVEKEMLLWNNGVESKFSAANLKNVLSNEADFSIYIGKTAKEVADMKQKKKDAEAVIYGNTIKAGKSLSAKEFKAAVHAAYFEEKKTAKPFATPQAKGAKTTILCNDFGDAISGFKKSLFAILDTQEKTAKQMAKDAKKMDKGDARTDATAVANACYSLVSTVQRVAGNVFSIVISEEQARYKAALGIFRYVASYKFKEDKKEENVEEGFQNLDAELSLMESDADMDLFFDSFEYSIDL